MPRANDLDRVAPDDKITGEKTTGGWKTRVYKILGKTKHSFSAYLARPKVFRFEERGDDEEILLVLRRHWVTNVGWIGLALTMATAPVFLKFMPLLAFFPTNYQFISILGWYLMTFAFTFEKFLSWYFNVNIITDQRVIDIDFNNLLDKKFSEAELSAIQDVTSRVIGVGATLFNYGDILIQTAAELNQIIFGKIPNPEKVIKVLKELRGEDGYV